jgi:hypothetical protein
MTIRKPLGPSYIAPHIHCNRMGIRTLRNGGVGLALRVGVGLGQGQLTFAEFKVEFLAPISKFRVRETSQLLSHDNTTSWNNTS